MVKTSDGRKKMTTKNYSLLAAVIFALVAVLQLSRALIGFQVVVGSHAIPILGSWIACLVAAVLAWLGFSAARN
jgi:hypothetical protein